jgi:hypothetical protein
VESVAMHENLSLKLSIVFLHFRLLRYLGLSINTTTEDGYKIDSRKMECFVVISK